jgi:hypothetical protein
MGRVLVALLMVVSSLAVAVPAGAGDDDVIRRGSCSANSSWKLKLSPENGRLEVEFEVDQNRNGQDWRVRMLHNGDVFFRGTKTTSAPSGSFEVRRVVDNASGDDAIVARARNVNTDETCRGRATF